MGTHFKGTKWEVEALNTFITLSRASESVLTATKDIYSRAGLTESQFAVLDILYHLGPQSQLEIGKKILKSRGNITMVIGNLEKNGHVKRKKRDSDRRYYSVDLTKKGRLLMGAIFPEHVRQIVKTMSALSYEEWLVLNNLCKKLGLSVHGNFVEKR